MNRRFCQLVAGIGVAAAAVVLPLAAPASAHAELLDSTPAAGAALDESPTQVVLRFSEPVEAGTGAIRVFDTDAERVDSGDVEHPDGASDAVALDLPELSDGSYVVTWRVLSTDSHPIQGAFTFQVGDSGAGEGTDALAQRLLADQGGSTTVGAVYAVDRWLAFAGVAVLVGGIWFISWLWPAGASDRLTKRVVASAWALAAVSTLAGIGLQGAYAAGLGLADSLDPGVIGDVISTRFGRAWLARLALLAAAAPLLVLSARQAVAPAVRPSGKDADVDDDPGESGRAGWAPASPVIRAAGMGLGLALLATITLSGHATSGRWIGAAIPLDLVHLAAISFWLGGLALLVAGVLRSRLGASTDEPADAEPDDLEPVVPLFSKLALGAVGVIVLTGLAQGWRQLGSIDAIGDTTYGRLLTVKVLLVAVMIGLAYVSRGWVQRRLGSRPSDPPVSRLRRSVAGEAAVAVAVLAVTSLLVNAIPGEQALALPYSTSLELSEELLVDLVVDPAKAGETEIHLYTLTPEGAPAAIEEVTAQLSLPSEDVGPLEVPLQRAGPNHFVTYGFDIPIAGTWDLEVSARLTEFDQPSATTQLPID